jgi:hypothetical protein
MTKRTMSRMVARIDEISPYTDIAQSGRGWQDVLMQLSETRTTAAVAQRAREAEDQARKVKSDGCTFHLDREILEKSTIGQGQYVRFVHAQKYKLCKLSRLKA